MPYYINLKTISLQASPQELPITVEYGTLEEATLRDTLFVYIKGGDGGDIGQRSKFRKYPATIHDLATSRFSAQLHGVNVEKAYSESQFNFVNNIIGTQYADDYQYVDGSNDAGYSVKHITGNKIIGGQTFDMVSSLKIKHKTDDPRNIYAGYIPSIDSNEVVITNGVPAKEIVSLNVYPDVSYKYRCQMKAFASSVEGHDKIEIKLLEDPTNSQLFNQTFLEMGNNVYLSGLDGFEGVCTVSGDYNYFSGLYIQTPANQIYWLEEPLGALRVINTTSGVLHEKMPAPYYDAHRTGFIYVVGNNATVDGHKFYSDERWGQAAVIGAHQAISGFEFFANVPKKSFFRIGVTGLNETLYRNMVNFYVAEIDYDDKDRKNTIELSRYIIRPPECVQADPTTCWFQTNIYYNSFVEGYCDMNQEFYYNYFMPGYLNEAYSQTNLNYPYSYNYKICGLLDPWGDSDLPKIQEPFIASINWNDRWWTPDIDRERWCEAHLCMSLILPEALTDSVDIFKRFYRNYNDLPYFDAGEATDPNPDEWEEKDWPKPLTLKIKRNSSKGFYRDYIRESDNQQLYSPYIDCNRFFRSTNSLVFENLNDINFHFDSVGIASKKEANISYFDENEDLKSRRVPRGSNLFMQSSFYQMRQDIFNRGGGAFWAAGCYGNPKRARQQLKNKLMIIHHGYNTNTKTYFWGYNGIQNKINQATQLLGDQRVRPSRDAGVYNYVGNFCPYNEYVDKNILSMRPITRGKDQYWDSERSVGLDAGPYPPNDCGNWAIIYSGRFLETKYNAIDKQLESYNATKFNLFEVIQYTDVEGSYGTDDQISDFISIVYDNLREKYSELMDFRGAVFPVDEGYNSESIDSIGVYYDPDVSNSFLYGKIGSETRYSSSDGLVQKETLSDYYYDYGQPSRNSAQIFI